MSVAVHRARWLTEGMLAYRCPDCQREHIVDRPGLQYQPCDRTRQVVLLAPPVRRSFALERADG